jgi:hypothetical protein
VFTFRASAILLTTLSPSLLSYNLDEENYNSRRKGEYSSLVFPSKNPIHCSTVQSFEFIIPTEIPTGNAVCAGVVARGRTAV